MNTLKVGIIGGSGLGQALAGLGGGEPVEVDTPFGKPSDAIVQSEWDGVPVCFLSRHGPGHLLNPSQVPYRANIFALKKLGCTHIIASGACGSLRDEFKPRDLVLADQVIDRTYRRAGTFFDQAAVHVEFAEPFCPVLRGLLLEAGKGMGDAPERKITVHDRGCYVCMEGPAFSTRAESLMHRIWGGDLIGMTAMPEAKLAREAEISYCLVAMVTDYDCWKKSKPATGPDAKPAAAPEQAELLQEIIANLQSATDNAIALIRGAVSRMVGRQEELMSAPTQRALQLAIWSDKSRISQEQVELLSPLWMKYFGR
ncbi:MAG TPA: S-methyl-5'-thioadenosine phosphorylase [Tepidisphaeraceae bacterium]|jgi:5'-methylthioadenosine phosphorylase|nr:S-methyl-5'-thioadenosine phosphorylase [Tepidisphaeraceae bacterium]